MTARTPDRTAAIEAFYREHRQRLERRVAARVSGLSPDLIEEACQYAWTALLRRPDVRLTNDDGGGGVGSCWSRPRRRGSDEGWTAPTFTHGLDVQAGHPMTAMISSTGGGSAGYRWPLLRRHGRSDSRQCGGRAASAKGVEGYGGGHWRRGRPFAIADPMLRPRWRKEE